MAIKKTPTPEAEKLQEKSQPVSAEPALVKMIRHPDHADGGPTKADVHPSEVDNFRVGGWILESEQK